jgi:DNA-3-methyladenine glycosylase II
MDQAVRYLSLRDRDLARIAKEGGRPPLWSRRPGLQTLLKIVMEQQVSQASGRAVYRRLAAGVRPLTARRILEVGDSGLRGLGITRQKSACCLAIATAVERGDLDFRALGRMGDADARGALEAIKGVGPWTAGIYLLMAMLRPDIWPEGDVALKKAVRAVKGLHHAPDEAALSGLAELWRPFRAVAARLLWHHYLRNGMQRSP